MAKKRLFSFLSWCSFVALLSACVKTFNPTPAVAKGGNAQFIASINGQVCVFDGTVTYDKGRFALFGSDSVPGKVQRVELYSGFKVPGTYFLGSGTALAGSVGVYRSASSWISNFSNFYTNALNGGTITVTSLDTVQKTITGSFNFPATSNAVLSSTPSIVQITNGSFINISWQ